MEDLWKRANRRAQLQGAVFRITHGAQGRTTMGGKHFHAVEIEQN